MDTTEIGRLLDSLAEIASDGPTPSVAPAERMRRAVDGLACAPAERSACIAAIVDRLAEQGIAVDAVAGATTSSILLASMISARLGRPLVYLRPRPKGHGKHRQMEGTLAPGMRTLLVVDVIADVEALELLVEVIAQHGGQVTACVCLFAADAEATARALGERSIRLISMTQTESSSADPRQAGDASHSVREQPERFVRPADENRLGAELSERLNRNRRRVAECLLDVKAVSINLDQPFRYASGLLSPIYTDCRLLISYPEQWDSVIDAFVDVLRYGLVNERVDVLGGTATSGLPHASLIADRLGLPMVYASFEGADAEIRGHFAPNARAVMVEDHVTTGKSVLEAARVLRDGGARVDHCINIFTYQQPKSEPDSQVPQLVIGELRFYPLSDVFTLLDVAVDRGDIGESEQRAVLEWLADPKGWSARHEPNGAATG